MCTMFAAVAEFGAMVAVLVPTQFVHGMLALYNNFVAYFEWSLA